MLETRRTERRIARRIEELVAARPSDRRARIWARSVADLERLTREEYPQPLTLEEERAVRAHLARVMETFEPENMLAGAWGK